MRPPPAPTVRLHQTRLRLPLADRRPDPEPPLWGAEAARYPCPTLAPAGVPPQHEVTVVVLEHEGLRLAFAPALGARLVSLVDLVTGAELLDPNRPEQGLGLQGLGVQGWTSGSAEVDGEGVGRFVAWGIDPATGVCWESETVLAPGSAAVVMRTRVANPTDLPQHCAARVAVALPRGEHARWTAGDGFTAVWDETSGRGLVHATDPSLVPDHSVEPADDAIMLRSGPPRQGGGWLAPGQELVQHDVWLPLRGLGGLSHATDLIAGHWWREGGGLRLRLLAAEDLGEAEVLVRNGCLGEPRTVSLGREVAELELPDLGPGGELSIAVDEVDLWHDVPLDPPSRPARRPVAAAEPNAYQLARSAEWEGDRPKAARRYREAAETEPAAASALARFALERGDIEGAERWARRAQALGPHHPEASLCAALAAREAGRRDEALDAWEQALGCPETRAGAIVGLIDDALAVGHFARAADRAQHLLAETNDVRAVGRLVHALRQMGDEHSAEHLLEEVSPHLDPLLAAEQRLLDPEAPLLSATAQLAAAATLLRLGDAEAAERILADPSSPAPGTPRALAEYARAYVTEEFPALETPWAEGFAHGAFAIAVLRYAVEQFDDRVAHFHLACALAAGGDWEQAESHWAAAADGPCAAMANRCLGLSAWRRHGDLKAAAAFYAHAVECGAGEVTQQEREAVEAALTEPRP